MEKTHSKKVIVIGAGIAGLTVCCYLQMSGFEVTIYESHNIAGGLCTSWKREGYDFDGCIHSVPDGSEKYKIGRWMSEIVDFSKIEYHYYDKLIVIKFIDGKTFNFYTNIDKLKTELLEFAPEDSVFINRMISSMKCFAKYDLLNAKPIELWSPLDYYLSQFKTAPYIVSLIKWSKSLDETISKCKSVVLKDILNQDFFTRYPFYFFLLSIAQMGNKSVGYPIGGSLKFVKHFEDKFISIGGKIEYNSRVKEIIVENDVAKGIILDNVCRIDDIDIVISAADGFSTIYQLLNGKYLNKEIIKRYNSHPKWPSMVLVSIGVSRSLNDKPSLISVKLSDKLMIDEQTQTDTLPVTIYNFDHTLAPEGKTCIRVILHSYNYDYWKNLRDNDRDEYRKVKDVLAKKIIDILEDKIGDIKENVEVIDVATPATFSRYTNNWQGSIQGWEWLPGLIPEHIKVDLPVLKKFYMTGQWIMPGGGVSGAFINARDLARIICKRNKVKFMNKTER